ncbi:sugar ABC transporter permease [Paenibacillus sp. SYP-B3998]|uniref:Sugar ABC transporter permease n=1 Tax=Paenibacillus sp. SYP-B3998 TaxID=2678564 RepID=A0A6G3ZYD5_9BACL|nr:ABC transporter permease subunit [Paenibacillus sp. SYP-B3998]NEW07125.1 sugar ABC transporter permease [Paenibacillus sp. SYP-B3998]
MGRRRRLKQNIPLMVMFIPVIAYFVLFKYVPLLGNVIAFKNYNFTDGLWESPWVGLQNFQLLFTDPLAISTIRNTFFISLLSIVVGFPFPILLALMFNEIRRLWFKKTVQTLLYLPHFLSWVIIGGLVINLFALESGTINHIIQYFGIEAYPFLYKAMSWISVFLGAGIWKEAGFGAIIYLAALSSIDPGLYEAASLDGAGKFRQMWHVTLPGIRSVIVIVLILSMGRIMDVGFDQVYNLQNSIVSNVSEVISTYIYRVGLQGGQFSLTAAMGLFEAVIAFVLVFTTNWIARKFNQGLW